MLKVLVTGASGMLGWKVANYLLNTGEFDVYGTGRKVLNTDFKYVQTDLLETDQIQQLLINIQPDIIVHCAANVDLNDCENNKDVANLLHVEATRLLSAYKSGRCRFVYISTDSVFDGNTGNYKEADIPNPLNYYALTKLEGEIVALRNNSLTTVVRTNIYGFSELQPGKSLFEWLIKSLMSNTKIHGYDDINFNPLYTGQLSKGIFQLLNRPVKGIIHMGCKEKISKYDFALLVADVFGFDKSLIIRSSSENFQSKVLRPKNTSLAIDLFNKLGLESFTIENGLEELNNDFNKANKVANANKD